MPSRCAENGGTSGIWKYWANDSHHDRKLPRELSESGDEVSIPSLFGKKFKDKGKSIEISGLWTFYFIVHL